MKILLPLLALALLSGCNDLRAEQKLQCDQTGGVYHYSGDVRGDDDVCVYSRDRIQTYDED